MFFMNLRTAEVLSKYFSSPAVLLEGRDFLTVDPVPHQKKNLLCQRKCASDCDGTL